MNAPIALFVYNRPQHTLRVLEALSKCYLAQESELFIFSDGPKTVENSKLVAEVRRIIRGKQWCGKVNITESHINRGLADSLMKGITEVVNRYGKIIILEDDILVSRNFLQYMNIALEKYESEPKICSVSGYMFPIQANFKDRTVFLPLTTSWGWATWKRAWDKFDANATGYEIIKNNPDIRYRFDLKGSYPFSDLLLYQMEEKTYYNINLKFEDYERYGNLCLSALSELWESKNIKNIALYGAGIVGKKILDSGTLNFANSIQVFDGDSTRWGELWNGHIINPPQKLGQSNVDAIIIASVSFAAIPQIYETINRMKEEKAETVILNNEMAQEIGHKIEYEMLPFTSEKGGKCRIEKRKKVDSWAIRWYWSCFKDNALSLFPTSSLVKNIGMDGSGTHCGVYQVDTTNTSERIFTGDIFPDETKVDTLTLNAVSEALKLRNF